MRKYSFILRMGRSLGKLPRQLVESCSMSLETLKTTWEYILINELLLCKSWRVKPDHLQRHFLVLTILGFQMIILSFIMILRVLLHFLSEMMTMSFSSYVAKFVLHHCILTEMFLPVVMVYHLSVAMCLPWGSPGDHASKTLCHCGSRSEGSGHSDFLVISDSHPKFS